MLRVDAGYVDIGDDGWEREEGGRGVDNIYLRLVSICHGGGLPGY